MPEPMRSRLNKAFADLWSSAVFVFGIALLVWGSVIISAQCLYWLSADEWIPVNALHTAFLRFIVNDSGCVVSLVTVENSLAQVIGWLPWAGPQNALAAGLNVIPFSSGVLLMGAVFLRVGRDKRSGALLLQGRFVDETRSKAFRSQFAQRAAAS